MEEENSDTDKIVGLITEQLEAIITNPDHKLNTIVKDDLVYILEVYIDRPFIVGTYKSIPILINILLNYLKDRAFAEDINENVNLLTYSQLRELVICENTLVCSPKTVPVKVRV